MPVRLLQVCLNCYSLAQINVIFFLTEGSSSTLALVWRAAPNGELPENAVTYKHWSLYHFCKTVDSENVSDPLFGCLQNDQLG